MQAREEENLNGEEKPADDGLVGRLREAASPSRSRQSEVVNQSRRRGRAEAGAGEVGAVDGGESGGDEVGVLGGEGTATQSLGKTENKSKTHAAAGVAVALKRAAAAAGTLDIW